jgi:chromosome segregation ATPase
LIELAIPFVQYTAARDEYNKIKNVQRQKHERYQKLEARQKPALNLRDELDKQVRDLDRQRKSKQKAVADRLQMMKQTYGRADALDRETQKMHERLQNLRAEEKERKKAIEELRNKIARLEKEAENPPETDDSEEITRQMVSL